MYLRTSQKSSFSLAFISVALIPSNQFHRNLEFNFIGFHFGGIINSIKSIFLHNAKYLYHDLG